jgi:hypothetical protein
LKFCRINLEKTNYHKVDNFKVLENPDFDQLNRIYYDYCHYHGFQSVMPVYPEDLDNTIFGYFDGDELVAWTLLVEYEQSRVVHNDQFAWNYKNPKLTLGIRSVRNECAYFKELGYKYMYLQHFDEYKTNFQGFELCGPAEL